MKKWIGCGPASWVFGVVVASMSIGLGRTEPIRFNDNGGWCWFQDERAILAGNVLLIGSVADDAGTDGEERGGNVEVSVYDLAGRKLLGRVILHEHLQGDDHATPALLALPDGRILAVYARHGSDRFVRIRRTLRPGDYLHWGEEQLVEREAGVTYSNLFLLADENGGEGRIYDFYRGENWNPNVIISDDDGEHWRYGGHVIRFAGRPYVKYASNNRDIIHFVTTEHHPRDYANSIYHGYLQGGVFHDSSGKRIQALTDGPIRPDQATRIFSGSEREVAWTVDLHLDEDGHPYAAFSVQRNDDSGDLRYRYARWDGSKWNDFPMAYAGSALYGAERDYSGLVALLPGDPDMVFISADVEPAGGAPLISAADGKRHYEIFKGTTEDGGRTWHWTAVTHNSTEDQIRPIVPIPVGSGKTVLLWLSGTYSSYTQYDLDVVGKVLEVEESISGGTR